MPEEKQSAKPFLKWAGGKRWLARLVLDLVGDSFSPYVEPFLGSGTLYFTLNPAEAVLADINADLINAFLMVRDEVESVIACLSTLAIDRFTFETIRRLRLETPIGRASRFIYLNRTAFNGLYRVNREGQFNVPFGCKPGTVACDSDLLRSASMRLRKAQLRVADFRDTLEEINYGTTIVLDPPYTVKHNNNGFRRYNELIFKWKDQLSLAELAAKLVRGGARIIVTNAWHKEVIALYDPRCFYAIRVSRPSNMAASAKHRGLFDELVLVSRSIASSPKKLRELLGTRKLAGSLSSGSCRLQGL